MIPSTPRSPRRPSTRLRRSISTAALVAVAAPASFAGTATATPGPTVVREVPFTAHCIDRDYRMPLSGTARFTLPSTLAPGDPLVYGYSTTFDLPEMFTAGLVDRKNENGVFATLPGVSASGTDVPFTLQKITGRVTERVLPTTPLTVASTSPMDAGIVAASSTSVTLSLSNFEEGVYGSWTSTVDGLITDYRVDYPCQIQSGGTLTVPVVADGDIDPEPISDVAYGYRLKGSAAIKTLTKGSVPLNGAIDANVNVGTGKFTADLKLDPVKARLTALGILPVVATVSFTTSGKTTGTIDDNGLVSTSSVRIKLPQVSLFGTIPLAGGTTCQTKSYSTITLSDPNFDALDGGTLAGTFAISDLSGCGVLNGLVSPLTAGKGNTIRAALSRK